MVVKVGLLFLFCWGLVSSEPQVTAEQGRLETLDFGIVPSGIYETHVHYEPGAMGILFRLVHAFLHVVQPNLFPRDLITKLALGNFEAFQADYTKAIYYETGFIVCAGLGALFTLLMPLIGLCFCVCRCCENCGGEMHQRQRKNADCRRSFMATTLFVTSLIIAVGVMCAYAANQNLSYQLKGVRKLVNSNMRDLQMFANQTPAQIEYLIRQYDTAKKKVISDLDNVGPLLGGNIHEKLGSECLPALDRASRMASVMQETKLALENMSMALEILQDGSNRLKANLSLVKTNLEKTLGDPSCGEQPAVNICRSVRNSLSQLSLDADFSKLPGVNDQLTKVNNVLKTDLSSIIRKGYSSFNSTPNMVKDQTKNVIKGAQDLLDGIGTNITNFSKKVPIETALKNFSIFISYGHSHIEDVYPQINQADFYRWTCCVVLCCMVVLILTFNFLGLLCGICGYDKHASPTTRGCISNTGGNLLMAGAGFTFIFSWVLMGVVSATFFVGGNIEKLVCEPFETRELFKVVDTPYLVSHNWRNYIPGILFKNPDVNLTAESLYSSCKNNGGIYSALQLDNIFNITAYLNVSTYTKGISKEFENVKVDLTNIVLLEPKGKDNLLSFAATGVDSINYPEYLAEAEKNVTVVDLLVYTNDLEVQVNLLPQGVLESSLRKQVSSIRQIYNQQVIPMKQGMKYVGARNTLSQSVQQLQKITSNLKNNVTDTLNAIEKAQNIISSNTTYVINQETKIYKDSIIGYFEQYINWIKTSLVMHVAPCKPFSNIVDSLDLVACSYFVDSVNAFWFGLGCATTFLIPSVILAVRLAKFYRRMDTEDVYDDSSVSGTWHFTL